jgi:hypothetical protein
LCSQLGQLLALQPAKQAKKDVEVFLNSHKEITADTAALTARKQFQVLCHFVSAYQPVFLRCFYSSDRLCCVNTLQDAATNWYSQRKKDVKSIIARLWWRSYLQVVFDEGDCLADGLIAGGLSMVQSFSVGLLHEVHQEDGTPELLSRLSPANWSATDDTVQADLRGVLETSNFNAAADMLAYYLPTDLHVTRFNSVRYFCFLLCIVFMSIVF